MKINAFFLFTGPAAPGSLMAMSARRLPAYLELAGFSALVDGSMAGESDRKAGGTSATSIVDFAVAQEIPSSDVSGLSVGFGHQRIGLEQKAKNALTPLPEELPPLTLDLAHAGLSAAGTF